MPFTITKRVQRNRKMNLSRSYLTLLTRTMQEIAESVGMQIPTWQDRTAAVVKPDDDVGHHSLVTPADYRSQESIVELLRRDFPDARFILEEKAEGVTCLRPATMEDMNGLVFDIDPIDGTSSLKAGLPTWSISIGALFDGKPVAGTVCAPMVLGGFSVSGFHSGSPDNIASVQFKEGSSWPRDGIISPCEPKQSVVFVGNDCLFTRQMRNLAPDLAEKVCVSQTPNSCALGMAYVAAGKASVIIQPHHHSYDWAGGMPLIRAAGGIVQWFHYRNGPLRMIDAPDAMSYQGRNTGFIAGSEPVVRLVTDVLQRTFLL